MFRSSRRRAGRFRIGRTGPGGIGRATPAARPLRRLLQRSGGTIQRLSRWVDVREAAHFDVVFVNRDLLGTDLVFERRLAE